MVARLAMAERNKVAIFTMLKTRPSGRKARRRRFAMAFIEQQYVKLVAEAPLV